MDDYDLDKKKFQRQSWVRQRDYIQLKIKAGLRLRDILTEIPTEELSRILDYAIKGIEQEIQEVGEADERQAALGDLEWIRLSRLSETTGKQFDEMKERFDRVKSALQSPRVPVVGVLKDCLKRIEEIRLVDLGAVRDAEMQDYQERKIIARRELAKTNELINQINTAITSATLSSARVHVIEGLDEAISAYDYPHTTGGIGSDDLEKVVKAARAYAGLQKGV